MSFGNYDPEYRISAFLITLSLKRSDENIGVTLNSIF